MQKWEADWLMEFHPDKCEIIRITNRRKKKVVSCYSIHGKALKEVTCAKYLGVTIDRKLTTNDHIDQHNKEGQQHQGFLTVQHQELPPSHQIVVLPDLCKAYCGVCVNCMGPIHQKVHQSSWECPETSSPLRNERLPATQQRREHAWEFGMEVTREKTSWCQVDDAVPHQPQTGWCDNEVTRRRTNTHQRQHLSLLPDFHPRRLPTNSHSSPAPSDCGTRAHKN